MDGCSIERAVTFRRGIVSGNSVAAHIMVSKCWFPLFVLGRGPTRSTKTHLNDSPTKEFGAVAESPDLASPRSGRCDRNGRTTPHRILNQAKRNTRFYVFCKS